MKNLIYIFCLILVLLASCKESTKEEHNCNDDWKEHMLVNSELGIAMAVRGPYRTGDSICFGGDSQILGRLSKEYSFYTVFISSVEKEDLVVEIFEDHSILIDSVLVSPVHLMEDTARFWHEIKYATKKEMETVHGVEVREDTIRSNTYGKYLIESFRLDHDKEELFIFFRFKCKGVEHKVKVPVIYDQGEVRMKKKEDRFTDKYFMRDSLNGKL